MKLEPGEDLNLVEAAVARIERWPEMHMARPEPLRGTKVGKDQVEAAERIVA